MGKRGLQWIVVGEPRGYVDTNPIHPTAAFFDRDHSFEVTVAI